MTKTISRIPKRHTEIISGMFSLCSSAVQKGAVISVNFTNEKTSDYDSIYEFVIDWPESASQVSSYTESPENDPDENRIEITNIVLSSEEIEKPIKSRNRY
jgi:hypothetical protein